MMEYVAGLAQELGFDGIDINMGCPDRSIEKQGAGAGLIKNPKLAKELIASARKGGGGLPISVKTRIGYNRDELDDWLPMLLSAGPAAVVLHARTRKEMSKVPAHWDVVARAVSIRDGAGIDTLILGNGDVSTVEDARQRAQETGADGVMIGRGIFGTPWLFSEDSAWKEISVQKRCEILLEHSKLFEELLPNKNFSIMKKHYKAYLTGFDGASELRGRLMEAGSAKEVESVLLSEGVL
jgi:tRNA-dihydrouridine synthase